MASHYTLRNFIRQASHPLIADYLQARGIDPGLDIRPIKPRKHEPIVAALSALPDEQRNIVDRDLIEVTALADRAGLQQIVDEARFQSIDLSAGLQSQHSILNKVFWTYLNCPEVFEGAARFAVPYTQGRYWKRHLPVTSAPDLDPNAKIKALEAALSRYFLEEEGRGKACQVEHHARGPLHQFHAYPEDFPAAPLAWSSRGLEPLPHRPAFEVIFVYHEVEGTLDIYFEGSKQTVEQLWRLFALAVLGIEQLPKPAKAAYSLERLKPRGVAFVRPVDSPILDIRIKRLRFLILSFRSTVLAVETDVSRDPQAIHEAVRRIFGDGAPESGRFTLSQAKVIGATLQATIDKGDGKRPRTRTFDLSERACSLKYEETDLLLRRVLIDSGIDQTGDEADAGAGPTRQAIEQLAG